MVDVDCAVGAAPCLAPADDAGYEVDEAEVVYWGRCPECLAGAQALPRAEAETVPARRALRTGGGSDTDR
jgi:Fur family ferric uptake transcriptional regulator